MVSQNTIGPNVPIRHGIYPSEPICSQLVSTVTVYELIQTPYTTQESVFTSRLSWIYILVQTCWRASNTAEGVTVNVL